MNIFEEVNLESEAQIATRLGLSTSKDGKSYVCPICGHGKGGDGIRQKEFKGKLSWHCYGKCGTHWSSNVNFIAAVEGISTDDRAELAKKLEELFPEYIDETFSFSKDKQSARKEKKNSGSGITMRDEKKSAAELEPRNFSKLYEMCRKNYSLEKFLESQGGKWRGLTLKTLSEADCLFNPEYMVAADEKVPVVIIPYDDKLFYFRRVDEVPADKMKGGVPRGAKRKIYVASPISLTLPNLITESELDALSMKQVLGKSTVGILATGSATRTQAALKELESQFGGSDEKPSFIIVFDNDETGKKNGEEFVKALRAAGYPAEQYFFESLMAGKYRDGDTGEEFEVKKVDANDLLQQDENILNDKLINDCICPNEPKLKTQYEAMETAKKKAAEAEQLISAEDKGGIKFSSFPEYFKAKFFSDIGLTAKYSDRKTGFENIDAAQIFMPGLYVLGALPATGKTTFAWQMLNQLADSGELCIYCSFEMSELELYAKSIVRELYKDNPRLSERLNLTSANIRRGACRGSKELIEQATAFTQSATNLKVARLSNISVTELIEGLKPVIAEVDKSPVICLDYLQIMPPRKDAKAQSTKDKLDDILLRLKDFQQETNSTLLIISSFNRENYFHHVSFSSFKESGAIEYSADSIWGLENYVPEDITENSPEFKKAVIEMSKKKIRKVKFSCLKNRNGGQYDCFFSYHAAFDYFEVLSEKESEPKEYGH